MSLLFFSVLLFRFRHRQARVSVLLNELLAKGFWTLLTKSAGAGLTLLQTLIFARWLGAERFGVFSLALTVVTILAIIARWGLDQVLLKQVASNFPESAGKAKGYLLAAGSIVCPLGLLLGLIIWSQADLISLQLFHKAALSPVLALCAWAVLPMSLGFVLTEAYKGTGKLLLATCVQNVIAPLWTLSMACMLWLYGLFDLYYAALSFISGKFITLAAILALVPRLFSCGPAEKVPVVSVLKQGWPMLLLTSGALIMNWSDLIVLGLFVEESDIGVYSVASKMVLASQLLLTAMNSITAPKFARFHTDRNLTDIADLARSSTGVLMVLVSFPSFIFIVFSEWVMSLFGAGFQRGASLLIVLAIGQFVNVACGSVGFLLTMTGNEKKMRDIMLVSAVVNVVLSVSLVRVYGAFGVACATAMSTILWNIWATFEVRRRLGFWTVPFRLSVNK